MRHRAFLPFEPGPAGAPSPCILQATFHPVKASPALSASSLSPLP